MDESTVKLLDLGTVMVRLRTWTREKYDMNTKKTTEIRSFAMQLIEQGCELDSGGGWIPPQEILIPGKANLFELSQAIQRMFEIYGGELQSEGVEHE